MTEKFEQWWAEKALDKIFDTLSSADMILLRVLFEQAWIEGGLETIERLEKI